MSSSEVSNVSKKITVVEAALEIALPPEILETINKKDGGLEAREAAMSTSVGGIGPLLRERIRAQSELDIEVIGVTLLYQKVWVQRWHSWGQLYLEVRDAARQIRDVMKETIPPMEIEMYDGSKVKVRVWEARYGKAAVYFLDVPQIGLIVYPGKEDALAGTPDPVEWAEDLRLKQSWVLGRGALQLLKILNKKPDVTVMSETPTMFLLHKLVKDNFQSDPFFENTKYIFNDHTPLEYAHPVWEVERLEALKIAPVFYKSLVKKDEKGKQVVDITQMIVATSDRVYGVSKKHGEVMRAMPTLKEYANKIETITNGVGAKEWLSPEFVNIDKLSDEELLRLKESEKAKLIDWLWMRFKFNLSWRKQAKERPLILWMRRITSYKRLDILTELIKNNGYRERLKKLDLTLLVGGRIHQHDAKSQSVMFVLMDAASKYPELEERIIVLDNFNVWESTKLYRGVNATIMLSDANREASATGFMKTQINGGLVIANRDGAITESVIFEDSIVPDKFPNGFEVAYSNHEPEPGSLITALELFRKGYDDKPKYAKMIRSAMSMLPQLDVTRTAKEMVALYQRTMVNQ